MILRVIARVFPLIRERLKREPLGLDTFTYFEHIGFAAATSV
jgi:hypothetical protein